MTPYIHRTLTAEQLKKLSEVYGANTAPAPVCAFLEVALREDTNTWREPPPAINERTRECRNLGITGLVMRRDPWWYTVPDGCDRGRAVLLDGSIDKVADDVALSGEIPWR